MQYLLERARKRHMHFKPEYKEEKNLESTECMWQRQECVNSLYFLMLNSINMKKYLINPDIPLI